MLRVILRDGDKQEIKRTTIDLNKTDGLIPDILIWRKSTFLLNIETPLDGVVYDKCVSVELDW